MIKEPRFDYSPIQKNRSFLKRPMRYSIDSSKVYKGNACAME